MKLYVILIVGMVLVGLGVSFNTCMSITGKTQETATQEAHEWIRNMYPNEASHVTCQNADTDNNGYVSCTVRVGERAPIGIECAVPLSFNNGCRIPALQNMFQRSQ